MLSEESSEFFHSETLVDRLDAYADFIFVGVGTVYKHLATHHKYYPEAETAHNQVELLTEWMGVIREQMIEILTNEILHLAPKCTYKDENAIEDILNEALEIVVAANEKKGTEKDADGKVKKGADYVKPEATIHQMLIKKLGEPYVKLGVTFS